MDAQEFRSLQEAYMEVVENQQLDEASSRDEFTRAAIARNSGRKGGITFEPGPNWDPSANRGKGAHLSPKQKEKQRRKALRQEEVDFFDVILEHLVAEGFADTNEAALAIMANMSEEWKQSIVEGDALRNTVKTLEGKRDAMNREKPGSANTAAPGKQSVGAATYKAYQRLRGV
jgi:hypothetical protein